MTRILSLHTRCAIVESTATMRVQKVAVAENAAQTDTRSVCVIRIAAGQHFN